MKQLEGRITNQILEVKGLNKRKVRWNYSSLDPELSLWFTSVALFTQKIIWTNLVRNVNFEILDYISCFPLQFFHALATSSAFHNRMEQSQGFPIC